MSDDASASSNQCQIGDAATSGKLPIDPTPDVSSKNSASALTPEEQMALYEKELKENDWGHQPC